MMCKTTAKNRDADPAITTRGRTAILPSRSKLFFRVIIRIASALGPRRHSLGPTGFRQVADGNGRCPISGLLTSLAMLLVIAGCGQDSTNAKTSHFEHDHEVAAHWPRDLADAASKIRDRLAWLDGSVDPAEHRDEHEHEHEHVDELDHNPAREIADLVSWIPEIAADTNLSEQDWIPLNNAAESLSANLRAAGNELTEANRSQTVALCERIEESLSLIPEQLPMWKQSSP